MIIEQEREKRRAVIRRTNDENDPQLLPRSRGSSPFRLAQLLGRYGLMHTLRLAWIRLYWDETSASMRRVDGSLAAADFYGYGEVVFRELRRTLHPRIAASLSPCVNQSQKRPKPSKADSSSTVR